MRRLLIIPIIALLILIFSAWGASAQARWSVWVYQAETGQLQHIDNTGQVIEQRNIPAIAVNQFPQDLVVASDGIKVAYVHPNQQRISIMDLTTGGILAQIELSAIGVEHNRMDYLALSEVAFDSTNQHLIYTEVLAGFGWQIHIYSIDSNEVIETLHYGDAQARQFTSLHGGIVPRIVNVVGDRVTFSADIVHPVGVRSYVWFYNGDILSETVSAPTLNAESFPYAMDIVNLWHDYRFPAENDDFSMSIMQRNTLHIYAPQRGRFPLFTDETLSFNNIWFVQGGERLLAQGYVSEIVDVWVLVGRDGTEIRRYSVAGDDVTGTPDGFIYTTPVGEQTAIVNVDTRNSDSAGSTLWIQPDNWRIVWAGSNRPDGILLDWAQLAQPIQDPSGSPNPFATPTTQPEYFSFRQIGQQIQIYVPEDGFLNLRDAPTVNSNVLTLLESGTRGTIISGPVIAEGFTWWEISTTTRTGWVVEELPDSLALIPPQLIPTISPTPTATP